MNMRFDNEEYVVSKSGDDWLVLKVNDTGSQDDGVVLLLGLSIPCQDNEESTCCPEQ
jgi:hypothetical protein